MPDNPNRYIPSEHSLDVDRAFDANVVANTPSERVRLPNGKTTRWKDDTNRVDLRGFDTRREQLPSRREVLNREGFGYIEREPDRFVRQGQVARDLIERRKNEIYDYRTFVRIVRETWNSDTSLRYLIENANERDYKALFATGVVQGWLRGNSQQIGIAGLMERLNLSMTRAGEIWRRLPDRQKDILVQSVISGKRFRITRAAAQVQQRGLIRRARRNFISQRARTGTVYRRARPKQFTEMEIRFITNRLREFPEIPYSRLLEEHNAIFRQTQRTIRSLSTKVQRLGLRRQRT